MTDIKKGNAFLTFCVVQHSRGPSGGYVVRTAYNGWLPAPYSDATRMAEYKHGRHAQTHADKLNHGEPA